MSPSICLLPFVGQGLDVSIYDAIATLRVQPALLKQERALLDTKWWDYRLLHPTEATYCFIGTYSRIFKEAYARDIDWSEATKRTVQGYRYPDQLKHAPKGHVTMWWKARQAADAIGARYSVFIRSIFSYAKDQGWPEYPRPQHLYQGVMLEAAIAAWDAEREAYLQFPESQAFHANAQHPFKRAFDTELLRDIRARGSQKIVIPRLLERGLLSKSSVVEILRNAK